MKNASDVMWHPRGKRKVEHSERIFMVTREVRPPASNATRLSTTSGWPIFIKFWRRPCNVCVSRWTGNWRIDISVRSGSAALHRWTVMSCTIIPVYVNSYQSSLLQFMWAKLLRTTWCIVFTTYYCSCISKRNWYMGATTYYVTLFSALKNG